MPLARQRQPHLVLLHAVHLARSSSPSLTDGKGSDDSEGDGVQNNVRQVAHGICQALNVGAIVLTLQQVRHMIQQISFQIYASSLCLEAKTAFKRSSVSSISCDLCHCYSKGLWMPLACSASAVYMKTRDEIKHVPWNVEADCLPEPE